MPQERAARTSLSATQLTVWANKRNKGFNTTDVPLEFCLLQGELAELFEAWKYDQPNIAEELADVAIYLLGLAQMMGIDLEQAVSAKILKNSRRQYERRGKGLAKISPDTAPLTLVRSIEQQRLF